MIKRLPGWPNGCYPDLILHKRGNNENNILCVIYVLCIGLFHLNIYLQTFVKYNSRISKPFSLFCEYSICFISHINSLSFIFLSIIFNNIFTLMYFCLLWIFNYLLFELFKIINDWYDENHYQTLKFMYHEHNYSISWMIYVIMAILLVIIQIVQLPTLFHIDAYLMFGFMILRSLKQIYKNRL